VRMDVLPRSRSGSAKQEIRIFLLLSIQPRLRKYLVRANPLARYLIVSQGGIPMGGDTYVAMSRGGVQYRDDEKMLKLV